MEKSHHDKVSLPFVMKCVWMKWSALVVECFVGMNQAYCMYEME
jgi:hypothetical protein